MSEAHRLFLEHNPLLYSKTQIKELDYYLHAVQYKDLMAAISLEQLWAVSCAGRARILDALENALDRLDCSDEELVAWCLGLETALQQCWNQLMMFFIYTAKLMLTGFEGSMTENVFLKTLDSAHPGLAVRAQAIKTYVEERVLGNEGEGFAPKAWGYVLRSLRDKVVHRDRVRPSFDSDERLLDRVLLDWPTLRGMSYERFVQGIRNGAWCMVSDLFPQLYGVEWKSGPYRDGMFCGGQA